MVYISVQTQDQAASEILTYCCPIVREALRHGRRGWQEYDRNFNAPAAIDRSLQWNVLLSDLQSATTLGQWATGGSSCSLCWSIDHVASQCALGVV